jgi:hypothetical protein
MDTMIVNVIISYVFTCLLSIIAYFLKQLHSDFKKVSKELELVKNNVVVNQTQIDGCQQLINQKINFIEQRMILLEQKIISADF